MRDLCKYSSKLNVIHFIMDHFQTDIFFEIIEENVKEKEMEGFTLFRENLACSDTTSLAIPPVFTAGIYDGSVTIGDFLTKNITANGVQNVLFDEGFKINIIPNINIPFFNAENYFVIPHDYALFPSKKYSLNVEGAERKQKPGLFSRHNKSSNCNGNSLKD